MPDAYQHPDGSFLVPREDGTTFRSPVLPTGYTATPLAQGLAAALKSPMLSKAPPPAPPAPNQGLGDLMGNRLLAKEPAAAPLGDKPLPPPGAVAAPGSARFLIPRDDGMFHAVETRPDGYNTSVVGADTAVAMRDKGGFHILLPSEVSKQHPAIQKAIALARKDVPEDVAPQRPPEPPRRFTGFTGDPAVQQVGPTGQWGAGQPSRPDGGVPTPPTPAEQVQADAASARGALADRLRANPLENFFTSTQATPLAQATTSPTPAKAGGVPSFQPKRTDLGMKEFEAAQRQKQAALDTAEAFERGQAERKRITLEAAQAEDDKLRAEQMELERQKQEKVREANRKYQAMLEESQKPGGKVDPSRWWNTRSTGQKIAAVMGQALASFSSGMRGGGPVDMIGKFVDQDLALQQDELARADAAQRQKLEAQGRILALTEKQYSDPIQAKAAARAMIWDNAARQLELREAQAGSEAAKAKYAQVRAATAEEAAKAKSDLLMRTEQLHLAQSANAREWAELDIRKQQAQAKTAALTPKELQDQVEGLGKDMQPLVRASGAIRNLDQILSEAGKDGDVPGTGWWDSRKLAIFDGEKDITAKQAKDQLGGIIGNILSGAGMSDTEREQRLSAYGLAKNSTEAEFRAGYPAARAFFQDQINTIQAKYHPAAVDTYRQRLRDASRR
jgi:hypothetical protein